MRGARTAPILRPVPWKKRRTTISLILPTATELLPQARQQHPRLRRGRQSSPPEAFHQVQRGSPGHQRRPRRAEDQHEDRGAVHTKLRRWLLRRAARAAHRGAQAQAHLVSERGRELQDHSERVEAVRGGAPGDRSEPHVRQRAPLHRHRPQEPDEGRHSRDSQGQHHPALARGHHELRQHVVQPQASQVGAGHQRGRRRAHREAAGGVRRFLRVRHPGPRRRARARRG